MFKYAANFFSTKIFATILLGEIANIKIYSLFLLQDF